MPSKCTICGRIHSITEDITKWSSELQKTTDIFPITHRGMFPGKIKGFICRECLSEALSIRTMFQGSNKLEESVVVTDHALERFLSRSPEKLNTKKHPRTILLKLFHNARKIRFEGEYMVERFLNNNLTAVDYFYNTGWIFVCTKNNPRTILSVERQGDKKLNRDFYYVE